MNTELSIEQQKIINAMPLVYERLVDFKIKMNSPMVIMKDDKIEYISPKELKEMRKEKEQPLSKF
ncbi:hypothetical protein [Petrimonas sp.]|uniref:hypothetical protein n=1 Tax=Petrimonas sp. TaxID=2023866 RepID=UPI003F50E377